MTRKIVIAVLIVLVLGGGAWYYYNRTHHTKIESILSNPKEYEGKEVTVEGEVTVRTAFFTVMKFFRLKDKTGEIIVVVKKTLPEVRSSVRVKGRIDEAFAVGDQKLVVFVAESVEEEGGKK
jgi:aspartyl/asparaginyl-tRNA synthetase